MTLVDIKTCSITGVPQGTLRRWIARGWLRAYGSPQKVDLNEVESLVQRIGPGRNRRRKAA